LLWFVSAAGVVAEADAVAQLRDGLSRALEANERLAVLAEELSGENARLRERLAQRDAEFEQMAAELAVLKRMVFGRSSEKGREPAGQGDGGQGGAGHDGAGGTPRKRGRAGNSRRDYSHLPRFEIIWDFEDGSYCCPRCGQPFTVLGDHVIEQVDWQVIVRLVVHRRRRYRRSCRCPSR
jgi:transposase